jgi:hypothetical protein
VPARESGGGLETLAAPPENNCEQRLYGIARRVSEFRDGYLLSCGGNTFTDELSFALHLDLENITPRLQKLINLLNSDRATDLVQHWETVQQRYYPSCDLQIFKILGAFTDWVVTQKFAMQDGQEFERMQKYKEGAPPTLTDMLSNRLAACLELSALGNQYLRMHGYDSSYIGGACRDAEETYIEHHSWVEIRLEGREFIWDVAQPHHVTYADGTLGVWPRIYELQPGSFQLLAEANKGTLIFGTPLYRNSSSRLYYGVHSNKSTEPHVLIDREIQTSA